jgi:orotate phosphoribosyltransferase-like protein
VVKDSNEGVIVEICEEGCRDMVQNGLRKKVIADEKLPTNVAKSVVVWLLIKGEGPRKFHKLLDTFESWMEISVFNKIQL